MTKTARRRNLPAGNRRKIMIEILTDENFEEKVQAASVPVLVDFYADWCGPCKMMGPILEMIAEEYQDKLIVAKLNVDQSPKTTMAYQVRSIPYLAILQSGELKNSILGAVSKEEVEQALASAGL